MPIIEKTLSTRVNLDIEGNQHEVIDARERIVMRYAYDMLSTRIHQASMEAGQRWMLNDVVALLSAIHHHQHGSSNGYGIAPRPIGF